MGLDTFVFAGDGCCTATDIYIGVCKNTFVGCAGDSDCSAGDDYAAGVALDTFAHGIDGECTVVDDHAVVGVPTVTDFGGEVDDARAGTETDVIVRGKCVLVVAGDGETARTGETDLSLAKESRLAVLG